MCLNIPLNGRIIQWGTGRWGNQLTTRSTATATHWQTDWVTKIHSIVCLFPFYSVCSCKRMEGSRQGVGEIKKGEKTEWISRQKNESIHPLNTTCPSHYPPLLKPFSTIHHVYELLVDVQRSTCYCVKPRGGNTSSQSASLLCMYLSSSATSTTYFCIQVLRSAFWVRHFPCVCASACDHAWILTGTHVIIVTLTADSKIHIKSISPFPCFCSFPSSPDSLVSNKQRLRRDMPLAVHGYIIKMQWNTETKKSISDKHWTIAYFCPTTYLKKNAHGFTFLLCCCPIICLTWPLCIYLFIY